MSDENSDKIEIFCRFITVKGKKVYPKKAKFFHFFVERKK